MLSLLRAQLLFIALNIFVCAWPYLSHRAAPADVDALRLYSQQRHGLIFASETERAVS